MLFTQPFHLAFVALLSSQAVLGHGDSKGELNDDTTFDAEWLSGPKSPADWAGDEKVLKDIPQYVLDYAPIIHLHSKEPFWPGMMDEHLEHTTPYLNDLAVDELEQNLSLDELSKLNAHLPPWWIFLTSNDQLQNDHPLDFPEWLIGEKNIPTSSDGDGKDGSGEDDVPDEEDEDDDWSEWFDIGAPGESERLAEPVKVANAGSLTNESGILGGKSSAPVVLIVVEKDNGVVDAFWFYFYHYNLGNSVFSIRFGNHVGDWEHNMVRFHHGVPKAVFFSEHAGGSSYTYKAVEKIGKRPRVYSATGTHAMYATQGIHPYVLPFKMLHDTTDRGPLWDPLHNLYAYHYNTTLAGETDRRIWSVRGENLPSFSSADSSFLMDTEDDDPLTLTPSSLTPNVPTSWFYYRGHWGDKNFNKSDPRQYQYFGEKAYVSGPMGPRWKALGRRMVCSSRFTCSLKTSIEPRHWASQFAIDVLKLSAVLLVVAGLVAAVIYSFRCCIYYGRHGRRRIVLMRQRKAEADVEDVVASETSPLLGSGNSEPAPATVVNA